MIIHTVSADGRHRITGMYTVETARGRQGGNVNRTVFFSNTIPHWSHEFLDLFEVLFLDEPSSKSRGRGPFFTLLLKEDH